MPICFTIVFYKW